MTIKQLKEEIKNIDDDFVLDVYIEENIPEEQLKKSSYPYPYEYIPAKLEIVGIGYSSKTVKINIVKVD